jgi:hypothetical protein
MEKINRPDRRKQNIINNLTLSFSRRKFGKFACPKYEK